MAEHSMDQEWLERVVPYGEMVNINWVRREADGHVRRAEVEAVVREASTHELVRLPVSDSLAVQRKNPR